MTEEAKTTVAAVVEGTRHNTWKFFGAIFMSEKKGEQAVSFHKLLGFVLFCFCAYKWMWPIAIDPAIAEALKNAALDVPATLKAASDVPDSMLYTLWGLLGLNGVQKAVAPFVKPSETL